jgi:hypothetical protein
VAIDLDDAKLLLQRAKKHIQEFQARLGSNPPTWQITTHRDADGSYVYSLNVNRNTLREVKPITADAANNLVHSLDHVAAACARLVGTGRSRSLFYPIDDNNARFATLDKRVRPRVGEITLANTHICV